MLVIVTYISKIGAILVFFLNMLLSGHFLIRIKGLSSVHQSNDLIIDLLSMLVVIFLLDLYKSRVFFAQVMILFYTSLVFLDNDHSDQQPIPETQANFTYVGNFPTG